jgi:hypothetical protein
MSSLSEKAQASYYLHSEESLVLILPHSAVSAGPAQPQLCPALPVIFLTANVQCHL